LVWRKVQKGTFINNTFVIKHHEFSTQVMHLIFASTEEWSRLLFALGEAPTEGVN